MKILDKFYLYLYDNTIRIFKLGKELMKTFIIALGIFLADKLNLIIEVIGGLSILFKSIVIAISGGFIDYMLQTKKNSETFSFKKSIFHCFVAGFTGLLAQKLCAGFSINADLTSFLIGISGFAGTRTLSFFEKFSKSFFEKLMQVEIDIRMNKNKDKEDEQKKDS